MTKTKLMVATALLLVAATAQAYMGTLVNTEYVAGGVICTYQLTNGEMYRVAYSGRYSCPFTI